MKMQMQTWMLRKYDVICEERFADTVRYKKYAKKDACVDENVEQNAQLDGNAQWLS